jgi:hypothetical protein
MLHPIAPGIWHAQRAMTAAGIPMTTRMTVIQLADGSLWLHSPIQIDDALRAELDALGPVRCIVAPNKTHHLFAKKCLAMYPQATLFGAPGLSDKRADLAPLTTLTATAPPQWAGQIDQVFIGGVPLVNETVFFHRASNSAIFTDVVQLWRGQLNWKTALYAHLTGVRNRFAVPRTVRLAVKDKAAFRASAQQVLAWPIQCVLVAHNSVVEVSAHAGLKRALEAV